MPSEVVWKLPTKHPYVRNKDGSESNVRFASFTFTENGKNVTYAIPTMVNGKQLSNKDAVRIARKNGLSKYPSFESVSSAEEWISNNHGNVMEDGTIVKRDEIRMEPRGIYQ